MPGIKPNTQSKSAFPQQKRKQGNNLYMGKTSYVIGDLGPLKRKEPMCTV